ncbi:hypothetical protein HELRODRAFT_165452 [Helobdella robusta]|uniref:Uncharacterized protein n=1 Tax=Helobdella robusta TaxID=6412 RepID=T1EWT8_HELRO|nr:hypothetical protein HELRODRAFT_165452 [Helobdella robusta]ESN91420.1 hypothetical protein HELRODRAFT_165452 [Helobdella robusta]
MNHNETWKRGIVRSKHQAPRSYIVDTEDGSTLRRNRRDLIYAKEDPPICAAPVDDSTDHFSPLEATQPQRLESPIHPQCNSPTDDTTQSSQESILKTRSSRSSKLFCKNYPGADCGSDHNPVICRIKIELKKIKCEVAQKNLNFVTLSQNDEIKYIVFSY